MFHKIMRWVFLCISLAAAGVICRLYGLYALLLLFIAFACWVLYVNEYIEIDREENAEAFERWIRDVHPDLIDVFKLDRDDKRRK